jgi:2,3-bisphosphoglycerate-dependent phosphoglycerate mutase
MSAQWVPLQKFWRLNERCYGDLEGKKREDVAKEVGDDQVKIWRRSFDVPPPSLAVTDARSPVKDPRYADLDPRVIPASESLKDVIARVGPYWTDQLRPAIKSGKTVLVVGHSTNLRALSAWIEPNLDEKALQKLEIKNTKPILYEFDKNMNVICRKVLEPSTVKKE